MSTPHLYLSALPFSPKKGHISYKFADMFHGLPKVVSRHRVTWSEIQNEICGDSDGIHSKPFSPDEKTVGTWDDDIEELMPPPLEGHGDSVYSVAFSPDGKRIVSGSDDKTIRLWNAVTGELLLSPLEGHEDWVRCVAFSPDRSEERRVGKECA